MDAADTAKSVSSARSAEYGGLPMGIQSYTLRSLRFDKALDTIASRVRFAF